MARTHGLASTYRHSCHLAPKISVQEQLRAEVRRAINDAGLTQRAVAGELGVSEQHISRMLVGRKVLTLEWAERIVRVCGRHLSVELVSSSDGAP